jgi:hypothetical protein
VATVTTLGPIGSLDVSLKGPAVAQVRAGAAAISARIGYRPHPPA